jgi:hypothetical protein
MDCKASDKDDPTVDPRFCKVGKQVCTDTGPRCLNATGALTLGILPRGLLPTQASWRVAASAIFSVALSIATSRSSLE